MTPHPSNVLEINDWSRLLDRRVAVVTGGGWFYSPTARRFVNRPTTL